VIANYRNALRRFSRDIWYFLATAVLVGFAWDGIRTVLFNLYLLRLGYGPQFVGLVNGFGAASFALTSPLAGAAGTKWGSRRMLILGAVVMTAGFGMVPLVEALPGSAQSGWLVVSSLVTHIGFSFYLVNGLPFMMGATGRQERDVVFSVHIAMTPLAAFAGSLLGGALPGWVADLTAVPADAAAAYRLPLWLAAVSLALGVLMLLPTSSGPDQSAREEAARDGELERRRNGKGSAAPIVLFAVIGIVTALRFGCRGTVNTFANVYLDDGLGISTALIGALSAAGQLLAIPVALGTPLLVGRFGNVWLVFGGTMGMALATLPLALIPAWPAAGMGVILSGAFFTASIGPLRVFNQELVSARWRPAMASFFMLGAGSAFATVSIVSGYAIAALGYGPIFFVSALVGVAGALFFGLYFRKPRGRMARGNA
jgi:predicted MFS family arabinose efflux permease